MTEAGTPPSHSPLTFAYLRALTLDLCVFAGKLDARLVGLCAGVGKKGAVSKACLHKTLGQLDLQQGGRKGGQVERRGDSAASAATASRQEGRQAPGQSGCAGRQAGIQAVFPNTGPFTWGAVWNRLLTCVSMLACSVTASTHRGSPWPAHRGQQWQQRQQQQWQYRHAASGRSRVWRRQI